MWLGEKLWSDDYDFFAFFDAFSNKNADANTTFAIGDIVAPRRFVVNGGDKRNIITGNDPEYARCISEISSVFENTDGNFTSSTFDEWTSKLKSKSILVDFGIPITWKLLTETGITAPENGSFDKILIVPDDSALKRCAIYFENSSSGEVLKSFAQNQPAITSLISGYTTGSGAINIPYAFELGFDSVKTEQLDKFNQNILLDPTISLGLSEKNISLIEIKSVFDNHSADRITKNFFDTGVSVRRYVEKDGSSVFVNRKSTLKISPDGCVEYTAEGEGKKITSSNGTEAEAVSSVMSLIRSISAQYDISGVKFQLHNSPAYTSAGEITVSLDYLIGSVPVSVTGNNGKIFPAATAIISDGRLNYFKFYACSISKSNSKQTLPSMLKAIDNLYSQAGGETLEVSDLYVAYITDASLQSAKPQWCARIKNSDRIIIINGE